jgi:pSer/pThr/pTyr-binding forkhead associated (FHA) protein
MNPESDALNQLTLSMVDSAGTESAQNLFTHRTAFALEEDDEEDSSIAKAPTLVAQTNAEPAEPIHRAPMTENNFRYIQAIVQDNKAILVTNLLGNASQTLVQPQMIWTIGRNREAALPLRDRIMSRRHAVILYNPTQGFYLIDLNSMNGSFINGIRIQQRQPLKDGDRIYMGSTEFSFFVSTTIRMIEPIHPEVLARFNASEPYIEGVVDYSVLEDDILSQSMYSPFQ